MSFIKSAGLGVALVLAAAATLPAQKLTGHRQFLSIEPYYAATYLDLGGDADREMTSGYGARLWIHMAPFSGPGTNFFGRSALALFATYEPDQKDRGSNVTYYGAEIAHHFIDVPIGGFIDPFFLLGVGDLRTNVYGGPNGGFNHQFMVAPGLGLRMPFPNRFQLRVDGRDILTFPGERKTRQSYQFTLGLGLTF